MKKTIEKIYLTCRMECYATDLILNFQFFSYFPLCSKMIFYLLPCTTTPACQPEADIQYFHLFISLQQVMMSQIIVGANATINIFASSKIQTWDLSLCLYLNLKHDDRPVSILQLHIIYLLLQSLTGDQPRRTFIDISQVISIYYFKFKPE